MEKFLALAKIKCQNLNLPGSEDYEQSWSKLKLTSIDVKNKGKMNVLKTQGDGNCLFRAVGITLTGRDEDSAQRKLRKIACDAFNSSFSLERMHKLQVLTHSELDCKTRRTCAANQEHRGAILTSSIEPYRRIVKTRDEYRKEIMKEKVWGNELLTECLVVALDVKINLVQKVMNKDTEEHTYKVTSEFCPSGQHELSILYSVDELHYQALIPQNWDLTGGNSLQLDSSFNQGPGSPVSVSSDEHSEFGEQRKMKESEKEDRCDSSITRNKDTLSDDETSNYSELEIESCIPLKKRAKVLKKKRTVFSSKKEIKAETLQPNATKKPLAESSSDSDEDGKILGKKKFLYSDNRNDTSNKTKDKLSYNYKQPSIDSMFQAFLKGRIGDRIKDSKVEVELLNKEKKGIKIDISQSKDETVLEDYISEESNNNINVSTGDKVCEDSDSENSTSDHLTGGNSLQLGNYIGSKAESDYHENIKKRKAENEPNEEKKKRKVNEIKAKKQKVQGKRLTKVCDEWFHQTKNLDSNGHKMSSYLRRVPNDDYKVECSVCHCRILVKFKGKSAINDHIKGIKHQTGMKNLPANNIGTYMEKNTSNSVEDAEIGIVRFVAVHGISFDVVPHLVKLLKKIFQDSPTCQAMGGLSRSRVRYGLIGGLGKTELDQTMEDMKNTPFSIQLDGGLKGGKHREQFLTRYFDQEQEQVVDKFILARTLNSENATLVADTFLDWSNENKVPVGEMMIMMNSDHASTLRGSKSGAITRISKKAPNIKTCDIGGDVLHDLNNSCKDSFY